MRRLLNAIGFVFCAVIVLVVSFLGLIAFSIFSTQNRSLSLALNGNESELQLPDLGVVVKLKYASSSPLGAAEYYRNLTVRLSDGRMVEFRLGDDWGGIRALSVYSTGTHLRILDCVTGFDIDLKTGTQTNLKDGYVDDPVAHLGSFVKGRGIEVTKNEPISLKALSMSC